MFLPLQDTCLKDYLVPGSLSESASPCDTHTPLPALLAHRHALTPAPSAIPHISQGAVLHINLHRDVKACSVHPPTPTPPTFPILFTTDRTVLELKQLTLFFPTPDHFPPTGGALAGSLSSSCLARARFALPTILPAERELLLLSARTVAESCAGVAADSDTALLAKQHQGHPAAGLAGVSRGTQECGKAKLISST